VKYENLYDKSGWRDGPWIREVDRVAWIDELTFYPCIIRRNLFGAWVGYVGVDELHPLFQVELDGLEYDYIDVHGGVKFAGFSKEDDIGFSPPKRLWWIGFSCTTPNDICPRIEPDATKKAIGAVYRTMPFAVEETVILAHQVAMFDSRQNIGDIDDRKINPDGSSNNQTDGTLPRS
jgi:hypothetical protein